MHHHPVESAVPPGSRIADRLAGASLHDSWSSISDATGLSALDHFILAARKTPRWIEICMRARNLVGGLVVVERVFNWPGLGTLAFEAIASRDYPVLQGTVTVLSVLIVAVNLLVDIAYGLVDPRIRSK